MHFLFLNFSPSKLLQVYRLLEFDEYDNIIVVILVRVGFICWVDNFRQCICRICSEELLVEGEDMLLQLFYNKFV